MKLKLLLMTSLFALNLSVVAQSNKDIKEIKYRRSSLHTILMESATFPKKDLVLKAYNNADFPDKYDNHNLPQYSFLIDENEKLIENITIFRTETLTDSLIKYGYQALFLVSFKSF